MSRRMHLPRVALVGFAAIAVVAAVSAPTQALAHQRRGSVARGGQQSGLSATVDDFVFGQPQAATVGAAGCGTNTAGEPSIHVSRANLVGLGSEQGLGSGSVFWRGTQVGGNSSVDPCGLAYSGQPNVVANGLGLSGGDVDTAFSPVRTSAGTYRIYVASLNLASVNVAVSDDNGRTFTQNPVQVGLPLDDREWVAAAGANTSLLTYHDIATDNIDVLRSDNGGRTYVEISQAIPATDYKAMNNQHGNVVIDHRNPSPVAGGFWAYQSFVAPSTNPGLLGSSTFNEAFVAVSNDGGHTWTDRPIPCSTRVGSNGLSHNFPNVSVAPDGSLWYAVSNDHDIYVANSRDHGQTWSCSGPVSTNSDQAIFPWLVATSNGVDLVYYGSVGSGASAVWHVFFAQNLTSATNGWQTPHQLVAVHSGAVCEGGVSCTSGRQLLDDFGVDTDQSGWAHIAYSHDAPDLGGTTSYTGYAVQVAGTPIGVPN